MDVTAEVDGVPTTPPGTIAISMQTSTGSYPIANDWNSINLSDFSQLVSFADDIGGEVTFWANYSGDAGDEQNRPIAAASTSATTTVTVGANFEASESVYELDWENETSVRVDLVALYQDQQPMLEGASFTWTAYNNTTGSSNSGSEVISNGFKQFIVTFSEPGTLFVNLTSPTWIDAGTNSLEIPLVLYGSLTEENDTEDNQTVVTPWTPETMLDVTLDCGEVVIDPSIDQEFDCVISNPNNYTIDVSLEADGWSQWDDFILFEPTAGQSEFTLADSETNSIEIRVEILQNLSDNGLLSGLIQIDLRQGPTDYTSPGDKPLTFEVQWTLKGEDPVIVPPSDDNNSNQTQNTPTDSSSGNTMMIVAGLGGVAAEFVWVSVLVSTPHEDTSKARRVRELSLIHI